jgi:ribosomal protein S18 acetylase RimI-like enzyme
MPAQYVKAYIKRNKHDAADAEAICEAVGRPTMRFVAVKTAEQQATQLLHRGREQLVRQRTMLVNALRAHLAEFGLVAAQGLRNVGELIAIVRDRDDRRVLDMAREVLQVLFSTMPGLVRAVIGRTGGFRMPITYRPARPQEIERAEELVVKSINDLTERHGFGPMASLHPPLFQLFSLKDDPDGLWVAEDADQMLGFAFSWVCGDLWFLAELFVSPGNQGRGIGNELLKRTLQHAQNSRAANKALITFTFNTVSQGLYIRNGLLPRFPIYFFKAEREVLTRRLQSPQLRCLPLENTGSHLRSLAQIDYQALGFSREKHHQFLISNNVTKGVALHAGMTASAMSTLVRTAILDRWRSHSKT